MRVPTPVAVEARVDVGTEKEVVSGDSTTTSDGVNTEGGDAPLTRTHAAGGRAALGAADADIATARNPPGETEDSKPSPLYNRNSS
ncbi:unnamed protein product [Ectocarpus sp. 12 AP-2014]